MKLTQAQKKWLTALNETGFVEFGWSMRNGQRNRPLRTLIRLGLAAETETHPDGGYSWGVIPTPEGKALL